MGPTKIGAVFPIYRRLRGGHHLYMIQAANQFEELQRIGARWVRHRIRATAYPELLRIHAMCAASEPYDPSEAEEWQAALDQVAD